MPKLKLKEELHRQIEECTEELLKEPDLEKRKLINLRRNGLITLRKICEERNKF